MILKHRLGGAALRLATAPAGRRFEAALADPAGAQRACLQRIVRRQADTDYGRTHGLAKVTDLHSLARQLPVADWEAHRPWVERAAAGVPSVLTREPVRAFEPTSGSTSANKLIPITTSFLREVQAGVYAWLFDVARSWPALRGTSAYWSISPLIRSGPRHTPDGIPIGLDNDAAYFGLAARLGLAAQLAVGGDVAHGADLDVCRYRTALALLGTDNLGLISVWSPTFLSLLMDHMAQHREALIRDLHDGTCAVGPPTAPPARWRWRRRRPARARLLELHDLDTQRLWPRLTLVSCWTSAGAAPYLADLRTRFPGVAFQGKGLLATEGVISIPWQGAPGCPLAVTSHLIELRDVEAPEGATTVGIEAARPGAVYSPVLTTGGGLYRYPLHDLVRVTGHLRATPCVEFIGRADGGSDLSGEKLHPTRAQMALAAAGHDCALVPRFAMLAPEPGPPGRYLLFLEADTGTDPDRVAAFARRVECRLRDAHHYDYCRRLGQLAAVELVLVRDGAARYELAAVARGQRAGDVKPTALAPQIVAPAGWRAWMC